MPFKISDLDPSLSITTNDLIQIIDVDDDAMGTSGTNKQVTAGLAANQIAGLITVVPPIVVTALSTKANGDSPTFTGSVTLPSTTAIGLVTGVEIGRLSGVTSNIQTQLDSKISATGSSFSGTPTFSNSSANSSRPRKPRYSIFGRTSASLRKAIPYSPAGSNCPASASEQRLALRKGAQAFNKPSGFFRSTNEPTNKKCGIGGGLNMMSKKRESTAFGRSQVLEVRPLTSCSV